VNGQYWYTVDWNRLRSLTLRPLNNGLNGANAVNVYGPVRLFKTGASQSGSSTTGLAEV
jgi:hypothetical protein